MCVIVPKTLALTVGVYTVFVLVKYLVKHWTDETNVQYVIMVRTDLTPQVLNLSSNNVNKTLV